MTGPFVDQNAQNWDPLLNQPLMDYDPYKAWVESKNLRMEDYPYNEYAGYYSQHNTLSAGEDDGGNVIVGGGAGGSTNITVAASSFWDNFPASEALEDYLSWYYGDIIPTLERQREKMPFDITIGTPEGEQRILDLLRGRIEAGRGLVPPPQDLSELFLEAEKQRLPELKRQQQEEQAMADERLSAMGLRGSTAGFAVEKDLSNRFAVQRELLAYESDVGIARAREEDWRRQLGFQLQEEQLVDVDINAYMSILGRGEERERRNIETRWREEMNVRGLPSMAALGMPTMQTGLGAMTDVYTAGGQIAGGIAQSQASAGASRYATSMGAQMQMQEQNFMKPFLQQAMEPLPSPSSGCIIVTACCGGRNHPMLVPFRAYRDEFMSPTVLRGYYILADLIVPLMEKCGWFKELIFVYLVKNLLLYVDREIRKGKFAYKATYSFLRACMIALLFREVCRGLGKTRKQYTRSNGEVF